MTHGTRNHFYTDNHFSSTTVTVFDSSITPEPFLDTVELETLKKRQQKAEEISS